MHIFEVFLAHVDFSTVLCQESLFWNFSHSLVLYHPHESGMQELFKHILNKFSETIFNSLLFCGRFWVTYCLHIASKLRDPEDRREDTSETLVTGYQNTWYHIPKDSIHFCTESSSFEHIIQEWFMHLTKYCLEHMEMNTNVYKLFEGKHERKGSLGRYRQR
jgi:hypothetical protein